MTTGRVPGIRAMEVPPELRAAAGLARPDFADAFAARLPAGAPRDVAFWHGVLLRTSPPGWISALVRVRGVLAGWLSLQTAHVESGGPFRLLSRTDDVVVAGADDRHLDFRVVLALRDAPDGAPDLVLVTVVQRHNLVGRVYFALVGPFHRRIVPALMRRAVRSDLPTAAGRG